MEMRLDAEKTLRDFLLGDLPTEQQESVELWLLTEEDAYDLMNAAEDDLIDDFLAGKLTGPQRVSFQKRFLAAPERQQKLQFSRALNTYVLRTVKRSVRGFSFWGALADCFRYRPVLSYAAASVAILLAVGAGWAGLQIVGLQQELHSVSTRLEESDKRLLESQKVQAQLGILERIVGTTAQRGGGLLAFNLTPGVTRSSGSEIQQVLVTGNGDDVVLFSLTLPEDVFKSYNVVLLGPDGTEKLRRTGLLAISTHGGKAVVVTVPTAEISGDGPYSLKLIGVSDPAPAEDISSYPFRPVRQ